MHKKLVGCWSKSVVVETKLKLWPERCGKFLIVWKTLFKSRHHFFGERLSKILNNVATFDKQKLFWSYLVSIWENLGFFVCEKDGHNFELSNRKSFTHNL